MITRLIYSDVFGFFECKFRYGLAFLKQPSMKKKKNPLIQELNDQDKEQVASVVFGFSK